MYQKCPKEKVGISFFQTAHFDLHLYPCIRNAQKLPKVIKNFLADIKRTMGVQSFMMVGYIGKDEDCWKCKWEWSLPSSRLWVHVDTYMLLSHLTHTSSMTEVSNSNLHRNYI